LPDIIGYQNRQEDREKREKRERGKREKQIRMGEYNR